jgi:hypothetical protein
MASASIFWRAGIAVRPPLRTRIADLRRATASLELVFPGLKLPDPSRRSSTQKRPALRAAMGRAFLIGSERWKVAIRCPNFSAHHGRRRRSRAAEMLGAYEGVVNNGKTLTSASRDALTLARMKSPFNRMQY